MPNPSPATTEQDEQQQQQSQQPELIVIDYQRLLQPYDDELDALIEQAYGFHGLGVLAIRNVPNYITAREQLLPLAYQFGNMEQSIKDKYIDEKSKYSFGWSHGKELLEGSSKPDLKKGSYYNNPLYNEPTTDQELITLFPGSLSPNIWPHDDLPQLETNFMGLGKIMCDTGTLLASICDAYVTKRNPTFPTNRLSDIIKTSKCGKARLLHYFPLTEQDVIENQQDETKLSSWCGAHLDSGSLTALTSAMFFDNNGQQIPNPDPKAGLYIKSRSNDFVHVKIPADCLAFQIGECMQIHSGGMLLATPHMVRAANCPNVSRSTFACFMQPQYDYPMTTPQGTNQEHLLKGASGETLPPGVPQLLARWDIDGSQNYGQFAEKTFSMYY